MKVLAGVAMMGVALAGAAAQAEVTWWAVPAMSGEQRLPDKDPTDGEREGTVRIVAAKEEYEPGSFVLLSDADLGKVEIKVGVLTSGTGAVFPAADVDLKVVKVWYQNLNGWFSYFSDNGNKLCPELLLNDEDLIRVDTEKQANYARLEKRDARGKVLSTSEQWLNPPRAVDPGFQCMRPEFRDAKTFQPVTLAKGLRKQIFVTVRTTKDTPTGTYRGAIQLLGQKPANDPKAKAPVICEIPVAVRVMDFVLPPPKAYQHPEMDFYVNFYNYSSISHIMGWNGHDNDLAWKQLEATLADCVKHGQTMHWLRGGICEETERTLDLMQKVGMRTDVITGGCSAWNWSVGEKGNQPSNLVERAAWTADYYDRKLGHHNVYVGYGDEPGCAWLEKSRWVFDIWQKAGFQFIIAAQNGIFWKVGYDWGWHNASKDPGEDDNAPKLWNQVGEHTHCAWYACHHVGPENPDFNRRQYGLGAYLAGYSAACNYAHHYGPYNDDGDYYKPMVFAYGSGDGVIDTIQWEGFREGIDDIRYATELCRLARQADKSGDFELGRLGRRALMYLASVKRGSDALDAVRGEMATYILKLRAALGKDAPGPLFAERNDKYVFGSLETPARDKQKKWEGWTTEGNEKVISNLLAQASAKGAKNPAKLRAQAAEKIVFLCTYTHCIRPVALGHWAEAEPYYRRLLPLVKDNTNFVWKCDEALAFAKFRAAVGDVKAAKELCTAAAADPKAKPASLFAAKVLATLLVEPSKDEQAAKSVLDAAYAAMKDKLDKKSLDAGLKLVATMLGGDGTEAMIRGLAAFRESVYAKRPPKKTVTVRYSARPISGLDSFAAAEKLCDGQVMDRPFGGATDMLETDVSTGARAEIGKGGFDPKKAPKLDVICDAWGVHVRLVVPTEDARKIEAGLVGGSSLEGYIAPGENTPYVCMTMGMQPGSLGFFNTAYDGATHRRVRKSDVSAYRQDFGYTDDAVSMYYALSWDVFPSHLPKDGDIWDFEQILWGGSSYTWNGIEGIHGRTTWGAIRFKLSETERATLVRKRLVAAKVRLLGINRWSGERTSGEMREGILDHWDDDVVGDHVFYVREVEPLVKELERACAGISLEMDDKTAIELGETTLFALESYRDEIARRRAAYLQRNLTD